MRINPQSVSRLFKYRTILHRLRAFNISWILSEQIASSLGVTASQVRKDFSSAGVTGRRKSGYQVDALIENLNKILRKNIRNTAVIAGFGSLGKAVYNEYFRNSPDIDVIAAFDENAPLDGTIDEETGIQMLPMSSIVDFIRDRQVRYGVIAVAGQIGQHFLDRMVLAGIRGIVSLSPTDLKSPQFCVMQTINPLSAMEKVVYFSQHPGKTNSPARYRKSGQ